MAVAMLTVFLALRKKNGCLYRSKNWKTCGYAFFGLDFIPTLVMSFLMYNLIIANSNQVEQSVCGVHNYSAQLLLGAQSGTSADSWAGLDPLYKKMLQAEEPVSQVFSSYDTLFQEKVVSPSFVLGVRMLMGSWVHELLDWRNTQVGNFDDGESTLLTFSDQSYESSQTYYPMSQQGTTLYEIDKRINDTVLNPIQMLETIEQNGLELKNNQDKFKD